MADIQFRLADFTTSADRDLFIAMLDHYSRDQFGGGSPLAKKVAEILPARWADHPGAFTVLAIRGEQTLGMANCLTSFSTFNARPRINIHDLIVHAKHRGLGIGRQLIEAVCQEASARNACQVSLEVRADNRRARELYERCGFRGIEMPPDSTSYLFGTREL